MKKILKIIVISGFLLLLCLICGNEIREIFFEVSQEEMVEILCDGEDIVQVREEHIVIPGVEGSYHFLYMADLHLILQNDEIAAGNEEGVVARYNSFCNAYGKKSDDIYSRIIKSIKETNVDAVLMGGDMLDYLSKANWEYLQSGLNDINIPYLYATADHDIYTYYTKYDNEEALKLKQNMDIDPVDYLEYDEFIVMSVGENHIQITEEALLEIEKIFEIGKPIIIVMHVPLDSQIDSGLGEISSAVWGGRKLIWGKDCSYIPDDNTQKFIDMIVSDGSPVVAVLAGHLHFEYICKLSESVTQYVFNPSYVGSVVLISVEGE